MRLEFRLRLLGLSITLVHHRLGPFRIEIILHDLLLSQIRSFVEHSLTRLRNHSILLELDAELIRQKFLEFLLTVVNLGFRLKLSINLSLGQPNGWLVRLQILRHALH